MLEARLRRERIEKYGAGSEKLTEAQLELLELEPGVSRVEVESCSILGALYCFGVISYHVGYRRERRAKNPLHGLLYYI